MFDDVATVFELNEGRLGVVLGAKENLCDVIVITDATFGWTLIATQTNTWVAAAQRLWAGLGAGRTIARLVAKLGAALMGALPSARLVARSAGLSTWQHALAVDAEVLTWLLTWRAVAVARLSARVRADQGTFTGVRTALVKPPLKTRATFAWTLMPTL